MPRRLLATAAAITVGTTLWMAGPSSAGSTNTTLTIDPTEGPPGTVITVTGEDCFTKGTTEVAVSLFVPDHSSKADTDLVDADPDGTWTAEVTVPADTTLYGVWTVFAVCQVKVPVDKASAAQADPTLFEYDDAHFTVPAPTPDPVPTPEPPAAAPVQQEADFTG